MKLFRRKSSTTNVPPEVAEYYQAERRGRRGMTWLMTFLALVVTVLIVIGLFLAGRWLYRTIQGDDAPSSTTSETNTGQNQAENQPQPNGGQRDGAVENGDNPAQDEETTPTEPDSTSDTESSDRPVSGNEDVTEPESAEPTEREPNSVPPESSQDELTNTGPGETAAVLFAISAVGVYVARVLRLQRR